ncbi:MULTISPECIES: hypothetical protein [unclassified Sporosarcina]|uniref:hypothetical protein n=1 Tax=unclassified Sporosarcina TaxID=2647733 RepID=UPI00203FAAFE|nr:MULTISPECIES: hypothetical protein [unclassified Sporosarcina]
MSAAWRGLFRKEWVLLKGLTIWIVVLNVLVILAMPSAIANWVGISGVLYEHTHIVAGTWFAFYIFSGVGILFYSLAKEMNTPEIWLHSPRTMLQLAGAKGLFAAFIAIITLFFGGMLAGIALFILSDGSMASVWQEVLALVSVLLAISLKLSFMMAVGFFFWCLYQVIRFRTRFFAVPLTVMLFFLALTIGEMLRVNNFFDWLRKLLPIKLTNEPFYNEQTSYFFTGLVPNGIVFSVGSLLFYVVLIYALFAAGSRLFEKKVRL